jgi:hypothetical protein
MDADYYLLERNGEFMVVTVPPGFDPLYGYGSWNLAAGPFATVEQAENCMDYFTR